jgi:hypothetical protein
MQYEATVCEKVQGFIKEQKMFTTVDVSNAIKSEGLWVRVQEVREWITENFNDKTIFGGYVITQIKVCNGSSFASLYHPALKDPKDYLDRDQHPLTPDEVKAIAKTLVGTIKDTEADINKLLTEDEEEENVDITSIKMLTILSSLERLKIPGNMIKALGWVPGQVIDPALILTKKVLPGNLKVNDDYRVSIPRTAVPWGTNPVKVLLKDGKIHFKKA